MRRLGTLIVGIGMGILVGIALPVLFVWRVIYAMQKVMSLPQNGTRVMATVTQIKTHNTWTITYENNKIRRDVPRPLHQLFARWEDPLTGKVYIFKSVVKDPEKFPVGSGVAFLIDPAHPRWHCIENMQDTGYRRFEA
jgi:hypothetical protein